MKIKLLKKYTLFLFTLAIGFSQSYVVNMDGSDDYMSVSASDNASTKLTGQFQLGSCLKGQVDSK